MCVGRWRPHQRVELKKQYPTGNVRFSVRNFTPTAQAKRVKFGFLFESNTSDAQGQVQVDETFLHYLHKVSAVYHAQSGSDFFPFWPVRLMDHGLSGLVLETRCWFARVHLHVYRHVHSHGPNRTNDETRKRRKKGSVTHWERLFFFGFCFYEHGRFLRSVEKRFPVFLEWQ